MRGEKTRLLFLAAALLCIMIVVTGNVASGETLPSPQLAPRGTWELAPEVAHPVEFEPAGPGKPLWEGKSGNFVISWTAKDLQARFAQKPGSVVFSANSLATLGFKHFRAVDLAEVESLDYERGITPVSVVGSLLSLREECYYSVRPSAHPGFGARFTTLDLARPGLVPDLLTEDPRFQPKKLGKAVKLTDLFPEPEILKALLAHPLIQEHTGPPGAPDSPQSLRALSRLLEDKLLYWGEIPFFFPQNFLTRFAFNRAGKGRVEVLLDLEPAGGAIRYLYAQLNLLLPIPSRLKQPLEQAATGQAGFLMEALANTRRSLVHTVAFTWKKGKVTKKLSLKPTSIIEMIWGGHSGGFVIDWSSYNLEAFVAGEGWSSDPPFSAEEMVQEKYDQEVAARQTQGKCEAESVFGLLSVVGPLLSFKECRSITCLGDAHPSQRCRLTTVNLGKPEKRPPGAVPAEPRPKKSVKISRLTDFFAETDILQALLGDELIQQSLQKKHLNKAPATLVDFSQTLAGAPLEIAGCSFSLSEDFLTQFAFYRLEQDRVLVLLGLPASRDACRDRLAFAHLLLPVPSALKEALAQAVSGEAGFMAQDQGKIARHRQTRVVFKR